MRDELIDLASPSYTPAKLLYETAALLRCKNDYMLSMVLELDPALLSRIRKRKVPITAGVMVKIMDRTGWHITDVRKHAGMPYDGVAKLVVLSQRVGQRFPSMWTQQSHHEERI